MPLFDYWILPTIVVTVICVAMTIAWHIVGVTFVSRSVIEYEVMQIIQLVLFFVRTFLVDIGITEEDFFTVSIFLTKWYLFGYGIRYSLTCSWEDESYSTFYFRVKAPWPLVTFPKNVTQVFICLVFFVGKARKSLDLWDYIFGWLIFWIFPVSELSES